MSSNFLGLNLKDAGKGAIVALLTALVAGLGTILDAGALPTLVQLQAIGLTALAAGAAYLLKNLFTNSQGEFVKTEPK